MKWIAVILVMIGLPVCYAQKNDLMVVGVGNFTRPSTGAATWGTVTQSSKDSSGAGVGYERWFGNNGVIVLGSYTPTDSKLTAFSGKGQPNIWPIKRYEWSVLYERRFRSGSRISPYVGIGPMGTLLTGGTTHKQNPADWGSGYDYQFGEAQTAGVDYRLTKRFSLRGGVMVDVLKASTFSDRTYTSSLTLMAEPQVGLVWKF